jgi:DNA modification methylase
MNYKINHANIKEWAANYEGELFEGILCDPPYELGFMGKSWDSSGIAFDADMWEDIYKLLKPGGHLLAFSGSRTYHRMAVAIEDAGFEIRDMIEWVYGSGFPKSTNVSIRIDKEAGLQKARGVGTSFARKDMGNKILENDKEVEAYVGKSEEAQYWNGYGTALKPAHEPCVLARKPIEGTVANNVLKHGTGGLNIDGCRVGDGGGTCRDGKATMPNDSGWENMRGHGIATLATGRFPANLIHDSSDEVEAVFPQTVPTSYATSKTVKGGMFGMPGHGTERIQDTTRSASRFFYTAKASKSERNAGLEGFEEVIRNDGRNTELASGHMPQNRSNTPKANHHPTVKPLSLTKYLATLIKPPTGGRLLVPFSGSGSEMIGALQAGWEYVEGVELTEEYIPIAEARIKYWTSQAVQEKLL